MRGCFHVLVFGDGLLSACDNRIVFHEVLVIVGALLGLTGFLSAVRVFGLVEVQRVRRLVESRRLAGAGRVGGRHGAVRQLVVRGRVETASKILA